MPEPEPDPLARYRDHARRVADEFGPGHSGPEALADAIAKCVHTFVAHDMEWAALAVEGNARDQALAIDTDARLLAKALRERGGRQ